MTQVRIVELSGLVADADAIGLYHGEPAEEVIALVLYQLQDDRC